MAAHETPDSAIDRGRVQAAQQMLTALFVLAKTARVYESNNDSYRTQLTRFLDLLTAYLDGRSGCSIKFVTERLFVDDQFVHFDADERIGPQLLLARWGELGIGGITLGDTVQPEQINTLLKILWTFSPSGGNPFSQTAAALADAGVDSVWLTAQEQLRPTHKIADEERTRMRQQARQTFVRAMTVVKDMMSGSPAQQPVLVSRAKRVIHTIIDQIAQDESALMELTSIKDFDEYTFAHCTNVSIYSLTLGLRLGLERMGLSELGFAALFHDMGKVKLPLDLVNKRDRFNEFDWAQMHRHPVLGAMTIAKTFRLDAHTAHAITAAYEHHINPDHTGYPTLPEPRPLHLYSRIISIADNFDALTSGRVYIKEPIPPDEVLRKLMHQMSAKFDPFLLKLFVAVIGIYPVGSLVLLSNQSLAIVCKTNQAELTRPEVRVIADTGGNVDPPQFCDLADSAGRGIDIVRIVDPRQYDLDLTRYILSD
jgi:HD-GYP domain-containing protein (c-di-GMP phosphodiesterase class II)